jgi:hypothetical protein
MNLDTADLVSQVLITAILVPLVSGTIEFFGGLREKRHRFDEHRLDAYSKFTKAIADILWSVDSDEASIRRASAWSHFEAIALTSDAEVVTAAVKVRYVASIWVKELAAAENRGVSFRSLHEGDQINNQRVQEFHSTYTKAVYKELGEFHRLARANMGLSKLDQQRVDREISKYYEGYGDLDDGM